MPEIPESKEYICFLCKKLFDVEITPMQAEIIQSIVWRKNKRIIITAMTRYGKTWAIAMAVLIYILFNKNKKIGLIAPTREQSGILRNYIADLCMRTPYLRKLIEIDVLGLERIKREVSRTRITFKNGCSFHVLSAEGEANRLFGFGFNLVVLDESCLIELEVYQSKISRMLGDDKDSMLVEIGNPVSLDNHFFRHWNDPAFLKIKVDWKTALIEGRTSQAFIDEQRRELPPDSFRVLYDAEFPNQSEDALFQRDWLDKAKARKFGLAELYQKVTESNRPEKVMGLDVAEMGVDFTVATLAYSFQGKFEVYRIEFWEKKDTMVTSGRIWKMIDSEKINVIAIDANGCGKGVFDRLSELNFENGDKARVLDIKGGRSPSSDSKKAKFLNQKAENYWRLRDLFEQECISMPGHGKLYNELLSMKYELTSSQKVQIIDPKEKSPDFADSLCYCVSTSRGGAMVVLDISDSKPSIVDSFTKRL